MRIITQLKTIISKITTKMSYKKSKITWKKWIRTRRMMISRAMMMSVSQKLRTITSYLVRLQKLPRRKLVPKLKELEGKAQKIITPRK